MEWLNWVCERAGGTPWGNGRPHTLHLELSEQQLKPGRVIIVGDIHGCFQELQDLLQLCEYNQAEDNLILAGDLINKGPDSLKVLAEARRLGALCIRGNHEDGILALFKARRLVGQLAASYSWLAAMSDGDKEYLQSLPFTIRLSPYRAAVVHAGLVPGVPLEEQSLETLLFLEDLDLQDASPSPLLSSSPLSSSSSFSSVDAAGSRSFKRSYSKKPKSRSWAEYWEGPFHVFFGHAADRGLQTYPFATGLDSGCVQGGSLTAAVLPPYRQLLESERFKALLQSGPTRPPTLDDLGATLYSAPARMTYRQPKSPRRVLPSLPNLSEARSSGPPPASGSKLDASLMTRSRSVPVVVKHGIR